MKRNWTMIVLVVLIMVVLTGCEVNLTKSYIFDIDSGEQIKVTLHTTTEETYQISQNEEGFMVSKDGEMCTEAIFQEYEYNVSVGENLEFYSNVTIIEQSGEEFPQYDFYQVEEDGESIWFYDIRLAEDITAIVLVNRISAESARDAFEHLTFELVQ